jgi:hypothetical protein
MVNEFLEKSGDAITAKSFSHSNRACYIAGTTAAARRYVDGCHVAVGVSRRSVRCRLPALFNQASIKRSE